MILITGATGTIGSEVLRLLTERGVPLRAMTRNPTGGDAVRADFDDPESLKAAVTGMDSVFLLTAPGGRVPDHDHAMITAAAAAGVRKVVKLSAVGGRPADDGAAMPSDWHAAGEQALAASDLAWTVLRPSSFASNAVRWAAAVQAGGPVPNTTGTGTQGVVDPRDVAAVAVEALLDDRHDGATYTVTGPELLSVPDQVAQLAEVLGRPLEIVDVPVAAMRRAMRDQGLDPSFVDVAVRGQELVRAGGNALVTDDVARVLGRPAGTFRTWASDHRAAFKTPKSG
jgi:uncharacterized protein YbjT (DUF2867 family)